MVHSRKAALMTNIILFTAGEVFLSIFFTLVFRNGSLRADIKVLATINTNTTDKDDALNHLIGGMRSSFGDRLKITSIRVQGR